MENPRQPDAFYRPHLSLGSVWWHRFSILRESRLLDMYQPSLRHHRSLGNEGRAGQTENQAGIEGAPRQLCLLVPICGIVAVDGSNRS
jgi:hypothetical protein